MKILTRITAFLLLVFLFMLGVNYRPQELYDYSSSGNLHRNRDVTIVDFRFLGGYEYKEPGDIPGAVKQLDGSEIKISGFMLPVKTDNGKVSSFLLLKNRMACCFGVMPRENEFVYAKMQDDKYVDYMKDTPVTVTGVLEIGKDNYVSGIYSLRVSEFSPGNNK